ncbi:MAG TPA: helix-hairpin-helix domain-containing protein [Sulfurovum sp.]|nr:helix-hairpin-helix domain-containing protein [Sulfurovum sp.]
MFKKIIAGFLVFATSSVFAMSLSALNSASKAELMEINGIGDVKAAAIIKERRKGKFKSFQDLERVEGIGEQTAANVKNGVKSSADVKKVTKKRKTKASKKKTKSTKEKAEKKTKTKKTKTKAKKEKTTKKRKIKSMDDKKKELKKKTRKTKAKKTKTKKTKAKKTKKTKSKKKN